MFIHHDTRLSHIAGINSKPVATWVTQQARNRSMELAEQTDLAKFLIRDRDSEFTTSFEVIHRLANDWPDDRRPTPSASACSAAVAGSASAGRSSSVGRSFRSDPTHHRPR
ncbi:MAG: hypothetical protein M0Z95_03250 [Actinomycetota bacterium]|nr:hypothetical protein [Actinomycetota bacterium]